MDNHLLTASFEFFPPKTLEASDALLKQLPRFLQQHPEFFSVTYGAGGSTQKGTLALVQAFQERAKIPVAPHLSCIGSTRQELISVVQTYQALGIKRIVALRGDMPSGMGQAGELRYASELVALIREVTGDHFYIEVAAYPEYHPQALNVQDDILNLKRKMDAGANSAITQYFYNPDAYFYFLDQCQKNNIVLPIIPGIMPITSFNRLVRFSEMCGAEIPRWIYKKLQNYGDDIESIKKFGIEVVLKLCETLLQGGAPGLHFYTLNQAEPACTIAEKLNVIRCRVGKGRFLAVPTMHY